MGARAFVFGVAACASACSRSTAPAETRVSAASATPAAPTTQMLSVTSPAFTAGSAIPKANTCEGGDQSPPLSVGGVPNGTQSLALVVEDPDAPDPAAPKSVWTHWLVYDLPPTTRSLAASAGNQQQLGRAGKNDWGSTGYRGPCPPVGRHRYFVRLYAVDRQLGDLHEPTRAELLGALAGHVLASGELMGTYQQGG